MPGGSQLIRNEFYGIAWFVGAIWAVFLLSFVVPSVNQFGVFPRTVVGLRGVLCSPFLHANWSHIISNTPPLIILLALLVGSQARSLQVVVLIVLIGGSLLWLFGRGDMVHIGASGLIFGLITYLVVSGFLEKRPIPIAIALLVGVIYGGTLLSGVVPRFNSQISWDGHLWYAVAGVLVAYLLNSPVSTQTAPLIHS